ncbi:hypothetical protein EBZ35_03080 [bacterium]|nr:hypothetical protein [bacterium]
MAKPAVKIRNPSNEVGDLLNLVKPIPIIDRANALWAVLDNVTERRIGDEIIIVKPPYRRIHTQKRYPPL